jgi:hypothetical protein
MPYISLDDVDDEDLLEELEDRNLLGKLEHMENKDIHTILYELYECKKYRPNEFDRLFSDKVYAIIGKII